MTELRQDSRSESTQLLLLQCGVRLCAVPLELVVETMRSQPLRTLPDMPAYIEGVSIVRGMTLPVVRLDALLGESTAPASRLVIVKTADRQVALSAEAVLGVIALERANFETIPLLKEIRPEIISGIGRLDQELLILLETCQIVPASLWPALDSGAKP